MADRVVSVALIRWGPGRQSEGLRSLMMTMGGAVADAPLPLDVLLESMRLRWKAGQVEEAVALAKVAAPYVHARPNYSKTGVLSLSALSDERLDELCALVSTGTDAEEEAAD